MDGFAKEVERVKSLDDINLFKEIVSKCELKFDANLLNYLEEQLSSSYKDEKLLVIMHLVFFSFKECLKINYVSANWGNVIDKITLVVTKFFTNVLHYVGTSFTQMEAFDRLVIKALALFWSMARLESGLAKCFLKELSGPMFSIVTGDGFSIRVRKAALFAYSNQLLKADHQLKKTVVKSNITYVPSMLNWIMFCGDYEIQEKVIEICTKLSSMFKHKLLQLSFWLKNFPIIADAVCHLDMDNFYASSRMFLNVVNNHEISKSQVISIPCLKVFVEDKELNKPEDKMFEAFWVDFSVGTGNIHIMYGVTNGLLHKVSVSQENVKAIKSSNKHFDKHGMSVKCKELFVRFHNTLSIHFLQSDVLASHMKIIMCEDSNFDRVQKLFLRVCYSGVYSTNDTVTEDLNVNMKVKSTNILEDKKKVPLFETTLSSIRSGLTDNLKDSKIQAGDRNEKKIFIGYTSTPLKKPILAKPVIKLSPLQNLQSNQTVKFPWRSNEYYFGLNFPQGMKSVGPSGWPFSERESSTDSQKVSDHFLRHKSGTDQYNFLSDVNAPKIASRSHWKNDRYTLTDVQASHSKEGTIPTSSGVHFSMKKSENEPGISSNLSYGKPRGESDYIPSNSGIVKESSQFELADASVRNPVKKQLGIQKTSFEVPSVLDSSKFMSTGNGSSVHSGKISEHIQAEICDETSAQGSTDISGRKLNSETVKTSRPDDVRKGVEKSLKFSNEKHLDLKSTSSFICNTFKATTNNLFGKDSCFDFSATSSKDSIKAYRNVRTKCLNQTEAELTKKYGSSVDTKVAMVIKEVIKPIEVSDDEGGTSAQKEKVDIKVSNTNNLPVKRVGADVDKPLVKSKIKPLNENQKGKEYNSLAQKDVVLLDPFERLIGSGTKKETMSKEGVQSDFGTAVLRPDKTYKRTRRRGSRKKYIQGLRTPERNSLHIVPSSSSGKKRKLFTPSGEELTKRYDNIENQLATPKSSKIREHTIYSDLEAKAQGRHMFFGQSKEPTPDHNSASRNILFCNLSDSDSLDSSPKPKTSVTRTDAKKKNYKWTYIETTSPDIKRRGLRGRKKPMNYKELSSDEEKEEEGFHTGAEEMVAPKEENVMENEEGPVNKEKMAVEEGTYKKNSEDGEANMHAINSRVVDCIRENVDADTLLVASANKVVSPIRPDRGVQQIDADTETVSSLREEVRLSLLPVEISPLPPLLEDPQCQTRQAGPDQSHPPGQKKLSSTSPQRTYAKGQNTRMKVSEGQEQMVHHSRFIKPFGNKIDAKSSNVSKAKVKINTRNESVAKIVSKFKSSFARVLKKSHSSINTAKKEMVVCINKLEKVVSTLEKHQMDLDNEQDAYNLMCDSYIESLNDEL